VVVKTAEHPLHPVAGRACFVPRLGHGQQRLLGLLAREGVRTTVSPLHYMGHNRELSLFSSAAEPMGLALDPHTHWRQLPVTHRGKAYRAQAFGNGPAFAPDTDAVDLRGLLALAERPIDDQRAHGATLLLTSYHVCGGPGTRGRTLDLELARAGAEHFAAQRMDQPAEHAAVGVGRELFAVVAVAKDVVASPAAIEGLAAAYADLPVAGYWVKIEDFWQRSAVGALEGAAALLGALAETGRPVVCCGPGWLHLALLVADISSSVGIGEAERFALPDVTRPRRAGPRPTLAYHPAYLRSFQVGAAPCVRAFAAAPCRCGTHRRDRPPAAGAADEHTALVRAREAREAVAGTREERVEWLQATAAMATHVGHDAGVDVAPYRIFEAVLDGVDAGRRGDVAAIG